MTWYWVKRVVFSLIGLLAVLTFVFVGGRMIGDPAMLMLGPEGRPEDILRVREAMGLADPLLVQYGRFISGAVQGDFGVTFRYGVAASLAGEQAASGVPALPIVLERLPATFLLALTAMTIAVISGVAMGVMAAVRPRSVVDRAVNLISLAGVSTVDFWLGFMLIIIFSIRLGFLPTSGYGGIKFVILPALALSVRSMGRITQLVRSSMLDELSKPYITAAHAKGISARRVAFVHAQKNAAIPSITMIGAELAALLTGAIVIEVVFAWPGVGSLLIDALTRRDLPLIEATIFVVAGMVILVNVAVDIAYTYLDPRVRFG